MSALQKAVEATPQSDPIPPTTANNLGLSLRHSGEQMGDASDLREEISTLTGQQTTPYVHPTSLPS